MKLAEPPSRRVILEHAYFPAERSAIILPEMASGGGIVAIIEKNYYLVLQSIVKSQF